jgi:heptosyltransferase-2
VLRNNDIGDLLVVTPLFAALRALFPEAWIAAGVGAWNLPVLEGNPYLSEVLTVNAPWHNKYVVPRGGALGRLCYLWRSPEVRRLAERRFEIGIDVLGSAWGSLLMLRAGIPYRLGVRGYSGGDSAAQESVTYDPSEHVGRAALRFAEILGATALPRCRPQLFLTPRETEQAERFWTSGEERRRVRVVIAPGGGLAAKCWGEERFIALAAALGRAGDLTLLALGGERERALVAAVAAAGGGRRLAEPPGLRELFALVAASDLVVCNSSAVLHVAAAFERPTLVLLGSTFPSASQHQAQWGYPGTCRSLGQEPGGARAVATPDEALGAVRELLAEMPRAAGIAAGRVGAGRADQVAAGSAAPERRRGA